jgi:hypothetical protein
MFDEKEEKEFMTLTVHDYDREFRHFDQEKNFVGYKLWDNQGVPELEKATTASIKGSEAELAELLPTEPDQSHEEKKFISSSSRGINRVPTPNIPNGLLEDKPNPDGEDAPLVEPTPETRLPKANISCLSGCLPKKRKAMDGSGQTASKIENKLTDEDNEDPRKADAGQTADPTDIKDRQAETRAEEERMLGSHSGKLMVSGGYYIHENLVQFPYATDAIPF